ncbi:MAG: cytochrome c [Campylobacter sp.]|nr:cytochrome c [Campylobacter sp.]
MFSVVLFSDSFITDIEYGKMLYENPRGIGCDRCHGANGDGGVIASYKEFNKTSGEKYDANLSSPAINTLTPQELADGILDSKGVMPSYFLTADEIIAIYKYLNKERLNDK